MSQNDDKTTDWYAEYHEVTVKLTCAEVSQLRDWFAVARSDWSIGRPTVPQMAWWAIKDQLLEDVDK